MKYHIFSKYNLIQGSCNYKTIKTGKRYSQMIKSYASSVQVLRQVGVSHESCPANERS